LLMTLPSGENVIRVAAGGPAGVVAMFVEPEPSWADLLWMKLPLGVVESHGDTVARQTVHAVEGGSSPNVTARFCRIASPRATCIPLVIASAEVRMRCA